MTVQYRFKVTLEGHLNPQMPDGWADWDTSESVVKLNTHYYSNSDLLGTITLAQIQTEMLQELARAAIELGSEKAVLQLQAKFGAGLEEKRLKDLGI